MTIVLRRYWPIIVGFLVLLSILLLVILLSRQKIDRIPTRGVFVQNKLSYLSGEVV